ncbi:MAG: alpha/beta hydrolase-fold protein, partial [Byssovorax sp.]
EGAKGSRLEPGHPVERELRKGETHVYEVLVPEGRVVNGVVDQRGVDVVVRVLDPTGATIATVDGPNGATGPEPWSLAGKAGAWHLEVVARPETTRPGRYEAHIDEIITTDERDTRSAALRYRSPRLRALWKAWRADGAAAIERFALEMKDHAPIVEPLADDPGGDVLLTFARRSGPEVRYVALVGGPALGDEAPLLRFEETDLLYLTLRIPKDARFTYMFRAGDPPNTGATPKQREALFAGVQPDAWNPHQFLDSSFVELPDAPPHPATRHVAGVPEGRVVTKTLHSEILGEDRRVAVYLPAAFDPAGGPYPYLVVFDGQVYGATSETVVPTPTILDNLIAQGKVPPMLAVLVDSQATRERDLTMSAPFGDFLARELVPWVRRAYRATEDPAQVTLVGSSFGGLCAAYCAFHHPEVFGNALSQSGSFWFSPGAQAEDSPYRVEPGAMIREIVASPRQPVRFWMEVGRFEGGGGVPGSSQVAQSRHLRDVLLAKGYDVAYREFSGGHDYACWRASLADGLTALAGSGAARAARR